MSELLDNILERYINWVDKILDNLGDTIDKLSDALDRLAYLIFGEKP